MTVLGFLILLFVALAASVVGELLFHTRFPGGWLASASAGLLGAWVLAWLLPVGPIVGQVRLLPAALGATLAALGVRWLFGSAPMHPVRRIP